MFHKTCSFHLHVLIEDKVQTIFKQKTKRTKKKSKRVKMIHVYLSIIFAFGIWYLAFRFCNVRFLNENAGIRCNNLKVPLQHDIRYFPLQHDIRYFPDQCTITRAGSYQEKGISERNLTPMKMYEKEIYEN